MISRVINFIKPFIPIKRKAVHNDVIVPREVAPPYRLVHDYPMLPFVTPPDYTKSEGGEVNAHREYTKRGDDVIIIGGGRGVSTVNAARAIGPTGDVAVFEGSEKYKNIIKKVIKLNDVSDVVTVNHSIVGPDENVYDTKDQYSIINAEQLPNCDVLEMDCEGAEEQIMRNLEISPRIITIEIHPRNSDWEQTMRELQNRKYKVESFWSNEGKKLEKEEFNKIVRQRSEGHTVGAPLVTAIKK